MIISILFMIMRKPRIPFIMCCLAMISAGGKPVFGAGESRGLIFDVPTGLNQVEAFRNETRIGLEKLRQTARQDGFNGPLILLLDFHGKSKDFNLEFEAGIALSRAIEPLRNDGFRVVGLVHGQVRGHGVLAALSCSEILMCNQPDGELGPIYPEGVSGDATVLSEYRRLTLGRFSQAVVRRWLIPGLELVEKPAGQGADPFPFGEKKEFPQGQMVAGIREKLGLSFADAKFLGLIPGDAANTLPDALRILSLPPQTAKETSNKTVTRPVIIEVEGQLSGVKMERIKRALARCRGEARELLILKMQSVHGGTVNQVYGLAQELLAFSRGPDAIRSIVWFDKDCSDMATMLALACDQIWLQDGAKLGNFEEYLTQEPQSSTAIKESIKSLLTERKMPENDADLLSRAFVEPGLRLQWAKESGGKLSFALWDSSKMGKAMDLGPMIKPSSPEDENRPLRLTTSLGADPLGIAQISRDFPELIERIGLPLPPQKMGTEWLDGMADFLTLTSTQVILVILGMACLIIETMKPGLGLPGVVASLCFVLIFWSNSHIQGQIDWLAVLFFLLGIMLVMVEVFLIPGVGIVGLSGVLMILGGIALVAYGHWPQSSGEWVGFAKVLLPFAGSLLGSLILVGIFIHFVPNLPLINNIMIKRSKYSEEPVFPFGTTSQSLVGKEGVAQTDLRPSGTALILGEYLDVLTDGEFIPQGSSIQVVEVNPPRIIVRAVVESPPTLPL